MVAADRKKDKFWSGLPIDTYTGREVLYPNAGRTAREKIQYPVQLEIEQSIPGCSCLMCNLFPAGAQ